MGNENLMGPYNMENKKGECQLLYSLVSIPCQKKNKYQIYLCTHNKFLWLIFYYYYIEWYFSNCINKININKISKHYKENEIISL